MKSIGCSWISFDQFGTKHVFVLLLVVTLNICSGCCGDLPEENSKYIYYNERSRTSGNLSRCFGPFLSNTNGSTICGLKNCKEMITSCYKVACSLIRSGDVVSDSTPPPVIGATFNEVDSKAIFNAAVRFRPCSNDIQVLMKLITNFTIIHNILKEDTSEEEGLGSDKFACKLNELHNKTCNKSDTSNSSFVYKVIDRFKTYKKPIKPFQNDSSHSTSLLSMMTIVLVITVLVFIAILVFFYKSKFIKCKKRIGCKDDEIRENNVHDYEEIDSFPQLPAINNCYHDNTISFVNGSLEMGIYDQLHTDLPLNEVTNSKQQ